MTRDAKAYASTTASVSKTTRTSGSRAPASEALWKDAEAGSGLLRLRAQLAKAEKQARRPSVHAAKASADAPTPRQTEGGKGAPSPQRSAELAGISTDDFSLSRARFKLREAIYDSRYHICPHAIQHARAEGFLEHDILEVLLAGRVRAIYTEDHRWLVCGYYEAGGVKLPLHVVVQHYQDGHLDVVTAFVPKQPHHIISRSRLAVMLRYDEQQVRARKAQAGNKVGYKGKGRWKKTA